MTAPLITIVTSTLDAAGGLPHTLASVAQQRGASFEWLVVDGGSSDGTQALIARHEGLIARWTSGPDAGIYDAWNKACALARGEWLLFLGAGDEFAAPDTLARAAQALAGAHPAHDLVYGRIRYISAVARRDLDEVGAPWPQYEGRWQLGRPALPPHPAIFHHRSLFARAGFDARFKIAGDAHFLLKHALGKPPLFVPLTVVRTPVGGKSMTLRSAAAQAREIADLNRELGLAAPWRHRLAGHFLLAAKVVASRMPRSLGNWLADFYRRLTGQAKRWSVR